MTAAPAPYGTRPTRPRRTKVAIRDLEDALVGIVASDPPMTVRQVFYQAVTQGLIAKTEQEYKGTICRLLVRLRREGRIPYNAIADNTRWMRKPGSWDSLADYLEATQRLYRRNLWQDQDVRVEIWCEKDALAGVLFDVTGQWDVPLMVTRGYSSETFLYEAACNAPDDRPTVIYWFGDHDPSGHDMERVAGERLADLADGKRITVERVAVTLEQIAEWNLPTRPTKTSDTRSHGWTGGESVELDAIPAARLREMVKNVITRHLDIATLCRTQAIEAAERESLAEVREMFGGGNAD